MKTQIKVLFGILFCYGILSWGFEVSADTIFTDDFNSYTNGSVDSQGGWIGNGVNELFTVESDFVYEGSKALKSAISFPHIGLVIYKIGAPVATGGVKYHFMAEDGAPPGKFRLVEGFSVKVDVVFNLTAHSVSYVSGPN
jgi:hypothetical protein